jgi:hypothetical protein
LCSTDEALFLHTDFRDCAHNETALSDSPAHFVFKTLTGVACQTLTFQKSPPEVSNRLCRWHEFYFGPERERCVNVALREASPCSVLSESCRASSHPLTALHEMSKDHAKDLDRSEPPRPVLRVSTRWCLSHSRTNLPRPHAFESQRAITLPWL